MFELQDQNIDSEKFTGRISILISLTLTVLGLALVGYYYTGLKNSAEKFQFATSDNVTWTIVQMEVDYRNLQLALARAVMSTERSNPTDLSEIKRAFDIYYSRVDAVKSLYGIGFNTEAADLGEILNRLSESKVEIAQEIDAWVTPSYRDFTETLSQVDRNAGDIRIFTTQALKVLVADASAERIGHLTILNRYTSLLVLIVGLLFGMLAVPLVLQKRLKHRAIETARIADHLKRIIDASQDAVVVADSTGTVWQYNNSAQDIFGYTPTEAIGAKMEELFIPDRHQMAHRNGMKHYLENGHGNIANNGRHVLTACDKKGREFPVEVTIAASTDSTNSAIFIGIMRDISNRIENEKKLEAAVEAAKQEALAKERFLSIMSHEMRTPLQGVLATFDLLDDSSASENQRTLIDLGKRSGVKALDQVNNTLELARLNDDQPFNLSEVINPAAALKDLVKMLDPLLLQRGNTISLSFPKNQNIHIYSNKSMFDAVFENLLANANKFTKGGHLDVKMETSMQSYGEIHLAITIQDSGIGIARDQIDIIFDDFATAGAGGIHPSDGTGLGLGIVKRATEKMGGKISGNSTLGVGSAFTFSCTFKTAQPQMDETNQDPIEDDPLSQPRDPHSPKPLTLVVDDNDINQILIGGMLERLGCLFDYAQDGSVAIEKCSGTTYDLILMDLNMPNLNGIETCNAIKQLHTKQGPIVCITAQASEDTLRSVQDAGMLDVLTKPIRLENLAELLKQVGFFRSPEYGDRPPLTSRMSVEKSVIDRTSIQDLIDGIGQDYTTNILNKFELRTKTELKEIAHQLETGQLKQAADVLHGAAGSAGMLGAIALGQAFLALETRAREKDLRVDDKLFSSCNSLLADFMRAARSLPPSS
jgi:PAS domain S-box-containing protein